MGRRGKNRRSQPLYYWRLSQHSPDVQLAYHTDDRFWTKEFRRSAGSKSYRAMGNAGGQDRLRLERPTGGWLSEVMMSVREKKGAVRGILARLHKKKKQVSAKSKISAPEKKGKLTASLPPSQKKKAAKAAPVVMQEGSTTRKNPPPPRPKTLPQKIPKPKARLSRPTTRDMRFPRKNAGASAKRGQIVFADLQLHPANLSPSIYLTLIINRSTPGHDDYLTVLSNPPCSVFISGVDHGREKPAAALLNVRGNSLYGWLHPHAASIYVAGWLAMSPHKSRRRSMECHAFPGWSASGASRHRKL